MASTRCPRTTVAGGLSRLPLGRTGVNTAGPGIKVGWWRERNHEVDFVVSDGGRTIAIEVASGRRKTSVPGLRAFVKEFPAAKPLLIGGQGIPLEAALSVPAGDILP